jgi:hypothetical protein
MKHFKGFGSGLTELNTKIYADMLLHFAIHRRQREMFSKSLTKHFKGFGSGFTELNTKMYADMLLHFAIHRSQRETQS